MRIRLRWSGDPTFARSGRVQIWLARAVGAALVSIGLVGLLAASAIAEPAATYTIRPGDTLFSIAQAHGVSASWITQTNDLSNPSLIRAGQVLQIRAINPTLSPLSLTGLIPAPYYSQFDGSVWEGSNCGPAALAMALGGLQIDAQPRELRVLANRQMHNTNPKEGTTWEALAYAAQQSGAIPVGMYGGHPYHQWTPAELTAELAQKHPVLLLVRYRALPDHRQATYGGDHYIVALGFDRQGNVIYSDPATYGDGSNRVLTPTQLADAWGRTSVGLIRTAMALRRS